MTSTHTFGTSPAGAVLYAFTEERGCRAEFTAFSPPPPGDALCLGLTGRRESGLVAAILAGEYDHILAGRPARTDRKGRMDDGKERISTG